MYWLALGVQIADRFFVPSVTSNDSVRRTLLTSQMRLGTTRAVALVEPGTTENILNSERHSKGRPNDSGDKSSTRKSQPIGHGPQRAVAPNPDSARSPKKQDDREGENGGGRAKDSGGNEDE